VTHTGIQWQSTGLTHPGQRAHNEDYFLADPAHGIYVVADGVGGRDAGEIASRISCETIVRHVVAGDTLDAGFVAAQTAIAEAVASGEGRNGMAATAVALHVQEARFNIVWLGDCRAYLWDGKLRLLTRDHSLVEAMLARGEISLEQAAQHPQRNVILAALGGEDGGPEPGTNHGEIGGQGCFVLCSDGLCDTLDNATISEILAKEQSVEDTTAALLDTAVAQGCKDNVTVLTVRFDGDRDHPGTTRYAHSVRTFDPGRGITLDETKPLVGSSRKARRISARSAADPVAGNAAAEAGAAETSNTRERSTAAAPQRDRPVRRRLISGLLLLAVVTLLAGLLLYFRQGN